MKSHFLYLIFLIIAWSCNNDSSDEIEAVFTLETSFLSIGNNSLQVFEGGNGDHTIIFESGLGVPGSHWVEFDLFEEIGRSSQVIAYNRAGYSPSTSNDEERSLDDLSDDLDDVITALSHHNKVILVGWSFGGAIIRHYAIQHPEKVDALLFIDPTHEAHISLDTLTQAFVDEELNRNQGNIEMGAFQEFKQFVVYREVLKNLPNLPDVPVIVLTSIQPNPDFNLTVEDRENWRLAHSQLGEGVTDFTHIATANSGHGIHFDEPDLVLSAVTTLIDR